MSEQTTITTAELEQVKSAFKIVIKALEGKVIKNCASCQHWSGTICELNERVPPVRIQASGCGSFEVCGVPF